MDQSKVSEEDIEAAKQTAAIRIEERAAQLAAELITPLLASMDMIVYTSCGGDSRQLLAKAIVESVCAALDQNPIDLLPLCSKNDMNTTEGSTNDT